MTLKDLHKILDFAYQRFLEFPNGIRLIDMNRSLNEREILCLTYYQSVIDFLAYKKILTADDIDDIGLILSDSEPSESDYE